MAKHAACVSKLLRDYVCLPVYRGHLRMPVNARSDDHKKAKRSFLQTMRRWRERTGFVFEVHAVQHITDKYNCHWDAVAYSDAPRKKLRAAVAEAWKRAGGLRQSLVPMGPEEIEGACHYQAKDVEPERRRGTRYLPATQGMKYHWSSEPSRDGSSDGFWQGRKIDELWKELIAEWFPRKESSNSRDTCLASNDHPPEDPSAAPEDPSAVLKAELDARRAALGIEAKQVSLLLDDTTEAAAERAAVLAEIDKRLAALPRRNAVEVLHQLPHDHDRAVKPRVIAEDTGLPEDHIAWLLKNPLKSRGAVSPVRPLPGGGWEFDRWYVEVAPHA